MDDLVTWLRGIWNEDEAALRTWLGNLPADSGAADWVRRWLADLDAKRRILDRYADAVARQGEWQESPTAADVVATEYEDWVLRQLALPYADRPGYRDEWRP